MAETSDSSTSYVDVNITSEEDIRRLFSPRILNVTVVNAKMATSPNPISRILL